MSELPDPPPVGRYAIRVWLPDRPGGLGAVASRVGAVGGEIVGIEIIDRDGGQAIDDLFVELPVEVDSGLLLREIGEVDGVHIEDVRAVQNPVSDGRIPALRAAVAFAEADGAVALSEALCSHAHADSGAVWVAVVDTDTSSVVAAVGEVTDRPWVVAFGAGQREAGSVAGSEVLESAPSHGYGTPDTIGIGFGPENAHVIVLSRPGRGFLRQERRRLGLLAQLAGCHLRRRGCEAAADPTH